jgi:glycolate oxidase
MYRKVDDEILAQLRAIVGEKNVIVDAEGLEPYTHDETVGLRADPEVVVKVENTEQVSRIMKLANRELIPVVPRAGGQGLSGGAVATCGGIILSVEKMNRILEIDKDNLMVTVEPGVITGDLHRAVEAEGLFYPPDPASLDSCCIGGNIAEGAGGPRAVKYGTTKDYVCGLEAVLPNGEVIRAGGKLVKNATGYNLVQLLIGSEGTLAIVTKVVLRLLPMPKLRVDLLVPYNDFRGAAKTVSDIIRLRVVPTAIEFMERDIVQACEALMGEEAPYRDAAAQLLITIDGNHREQIDADVETVGDVCLDNGALDVLVALDRLTRERLWKARRLIIEAINHACPVNHMEDVVVPRSQIPTLLAGIREIAVQHGVRIWNFGHAGDGNVHVTILKDELDEVTWKKVVRSAREAIYKLTLSLGGQLTAEHGIGATRQDYLTMALGEAQVAVMRRIKQAFDPNNILNPAKILP